MPAWAMISCAVGYRSTRSARSSRDRRQAAAAVDQDRDVPLGGEREHRIEPLVREQELLRPGMELDPARAEVEAPLRLGDRVLGEVEAHEGDEPAVRRLLREGERAIVAGAERRVAVGLVQAEHERALDPVPVLQLDQVVVAPGHPVDVVAEVDVRVEDPRAFGQDATELVVIPGDQPLGTLESVLHGRSLPAGCRSETVRRRPREGAPKRARVAREIEGGKGGNTE